MDPWPQIIVHADMDAFYASVEQRDDSTNLPTDFLPDASDQLVEPVTLELHLATVAAVQQDAVFLGVREHALEVVGVVDEVVDGLGQAGVLRLRCGSRGHGERVVVVVEDVVVVVVEDVVVVVVVEDPVVARSSAGGAAIQGRRVWSVVADDLCYAIYTLCLQQCCQIT